MKRTMTAEEKSKRNRTRYLLVSSFTLLVSAFMLIMATIAWFTGTAINGSSASVVIDTKGIDLDANLYTGNDLDRDGELDGTADENDILSQYTIFNPDDTNTENACLPGTRITYRLVLINPNNFDADITANFSTLDDYFKSSYEKLTVDTDGNILTYDGSTDLSGLETILGTNSTRIMFKVSSLNVTDYKLKAGADIGSTTVSDYEAADTQTPAVTEYKLWDISSQQSFVNGVTIKANGMLVIDYLVECMQLQEIVDGYTAYCNDYITANSLDTAASAKVKAMCDKELEYVTDINITDVGAGATRKMKFSINYLSVKGVQK